MSLTGLTFALCFALAALLLWGASRPEAKRRVGPMRLAAAAWLPALLVCVCLAAAGMQGRFGEMRLTLGAVRADVVAQPLSLGGDRDADDIVTEGLRRGLLRVEGSGDRPSLVAARTGPDEAVQLVAIERGPWKRLDILGAVDIRPGDALCLRDCDGASARWFRLAGGGRLDPARVDGGRIEATGNGRPMPRRSALRFIPGLVFWTPVQAIHPLKDFLPAGEAGDEAGFLYQDGGLGLGLGGARWHAVVTSPEARIARAGGRVEPVNPGLTADLPPGRATRVVLLEARDFGLPEDEPGRRGRLVERRSVRLAAAEPGVIVARLDTPATAVLGACPRNGDLSAARILSTQAGASSTVAALPALGGPAGRAVEGGLPLPEAGACAEFTRGTLQRGDVAVDGRQAQLRLERVSVPWILCVIAAGWAFLSWRLQRGLVADRPVAWALVFALQMLLAVRALVGVSGAAIDTTLVADRVLADAAAAYVAAPLLFLAWSPRGRVAWPAWLGAAVFLAATVAGLMQAAQRPGLFVLGIVVFALAATAWQALTVLRPAEPEAAPKRVRKAVPGSAPWAGLIEAHRSAGGVWGWVRDHGWLSLLIFAVALRVLLALGGVKERLFIAVSAVYTPLLIIGFAGLIAAAERAPLPADEPPARGLKAGWERLARRWGWPGAFALLLLATVVALPMAVSDTGYALTTLAPLAAVGAWRLGVWSRSQQPLKRRWAWSAPVTAVVACYVAVLLMGAFSSLTVSDARIRAAADPSRDDRAALQILSDVTGYGDNRARLDQLVAPDRLVTAGASSSENLRVLSAHLSDYTSPVAGRGYMLAAPLGAIVAPVHLSDNVSAVHLMSPFGRLSAAAYLAMLAALVAASARLTRDQGGSWRRLVGLTSLTVLFGVAAYVILANLQLVLFTGRNVYLMAAASGSDLLEGLSLFALAWFGLGAAREPDHG